MPAPSSIYSGTGFTEYGTLPTDPTQALNNAMGPSGVGPQLGTITGEANLNALGYDQTLADTVNRTNLASQNVLNVGNLPGGAALQGEATQGVANELAGMLAPSTIQSIEADMAQRYGARGMAPDSAAISAAAERAMGVTAEQQVQRGYGNLATLMSAYPRPNLYGLQSELLSPGQVGSAILGEAGMLTQPPAAGLGGTAGPGGSVGPGGGGTRIMPGGGRTGTGAGPNFPLTDPNLAGGGTDPGPNNVSSILPVGTVLAGAAGGQNLTVTGNNASGQVTAKDPQGNTWTRDPFGNWAWSGPPVTVGGETGSSGLTWGTGDWGSLFEGAQAGPETYLASLGINTQGMTSNEAATLANLYGWTGQDTSPVSGNMAGGMTDEEYLNWLGEAGYPTDAFSDTGLTADEQLYLDTIG